VFGLPDALGRRARIMELAGGAMMSRDNLDAMKIDKRGSGTAIWLGLGITASKPGGRAQPTSGARERAAEACWPEQRGGFKALHSGASIRQDRFHQCGVGTRASMSRPPLLMAFHAQTLRRQINYHQVVHALGAVVDSGRHRLRKWWCALTMRQLSRCDRIVAKSAKSPALVLTH
jgi:hypothetical protein